MKTSVAVLMMAAAMSAVVMSGVAFAADIGVAPGDPPALLGPPQPDYTSIVLTADVARPVDVTWARISDFCAIKQFLGLMTCVITSGNGDLGTTRLINGRIVEVMVARTAHSYTYSQPTTPIFYHATVAAEPVDAGHSKIVYTLFYDRAPLKTPEAQAADRAMRAMRFQGAVDKMKAAAEMP